MSRKRLSMRKTSEILRLESMGLGVRQIARSLGLAHSTVGDYLRRAKASGLSWPLPEGMDEIAVETLLFPGNNDTGTKSKTTPDFNLVHRELRRKGVTLQLLWMEYKQENPAGYQYSRFCEIYRLHGVYALRCYPSFRHLIGNSFLNRVLYFSESIARRTISLNSVALKFFTFTHPRSSAK